MEFIFKVKCITSRFILLDKDKIYTVAAIDNYKKKISIIGTSGSFNQSGFEPINGKYFYEYKKMFRFNKFDEHDLIKYKTALALVDVNENIRAGVCYGAKPVYYQNTVDDRKIDIFIDGIYHELSSTRFRVLNEHESKTFSRKTKIENLFKNEINNVISLFDM
jgi:hypothetical protein